MTHSTSILKCPHCGIVLLEKEKHYVCENQHLFDKARQGYVNLLVVNQKKSADPGDNKEMIQSRADFLNKDYYWPLANTLNTLVEKNISDTFPLHIADIGCGEGYYLRKLKSHFSSASPHHYYGVDISKEAIRKAATTSKEIAWFVNSVIALPFLSGSQDILLSVFAPADFVEFSRVLKPSGCLVVCSPQENHLIELRESLFSTVTAIGQEGMMEVKAGEHFNLEETLPLQFHCELNTKKDIKNLLTMTPFYFKSSREQQAKVLALEKLHLTVDVNFWVFRKKGST